MAVTVAAAERVPLRPADALVVVAPAGAEEHLRRQHPEAGDQHAGGRAEAEGGEAAVRGALLGALPGAARRQPRLRDGHRDEGGRGGVRVRRDQAGRRQGQAGRRRQR